MCQSEVVVFGSHVGQICPFLKQTVDAWASKWKDAICLLLQVLVQNCLWELLFKICIWSLFHGLSTKLKLEMESFTCHVLGTCCWFDEPLPNVSWQPNAYFNWVILVCKRASAPSVNQCLTSFQWSVEICSNWDTVVSFPVAGSIVSQPLLREFIQCRALTAVSDSNIM